VTAAVTLRPVRDDDDGFCEHLYASTREAELEPVPWGADQKASFLAQQFAAQSAHYAKHYADASFDVVLVDGEPAGRLIVHRGGRDIRIVDVALLPEYRGHRVGTALLQPILDEASQSGRKVSIHVERFNPAQSLYRRLGFEPVGDEGVYLLMEREPPVRAS
jgi:ribosomal protein S18 acetylase RimI-like enzyme